MPQEFHVLKCFSCEVFQVHFVKKSNKWACKMCGEKQSLKKVYGHGSGKECRVHVQSLNKKRMINDLNESEVTSNEISSNDIEEEEISPNTTQNVVSNLSKWSDYLTEENQTQESEDDINGQYTFERPNKRKFSRKKEVHSTEIKKNMKIVDCEDTENQFNADNSQKFVVNPDIVNDIQKDEQISKQESKWDSFVTENEDSTDNINPTCSISNNIFSSIDENTLDDILDL